MADDNVIPFGKRRKARPIAWPLGAWLQAKLPPREYRLGHVLGKRSRWLLYGDTGIGKTLFGLMLAAAVARGDQFLDWPGSGQPCRVAYLDGEMPMETMQERMKLAAAQYGEDIDLIAFNREMAELEAAADEEGDWPALDLRDGKLWLRQLVQEYQPDVLVLDSIMSLVGGIMKEEESWAAMREVVRWLSSKGIAQIWLHHTGHDSGKSYGTKTREWEMDTVLALRKIDGDDGNERGTRVELEFTKARLRTPETHDEFKARVAVFDAEQAQWRIDHAAPPVITQAVKRKAGRPPAVAVQMAKHIERAYGELSEEVRESRGHDGAMVRKVETSKLQEYLRDRGRLDHNKGALTATARSKWSRGKEELINSGKFTELKDLIWRIKT
jgi:KaiC/GvpD/RAD55 family RecA-like ATPase